MMGIYALLCICHVAEIDLVLGARGFHVSNPPVLQSMLLKASLDVFSQTSMSQLCAKSRLLTGYLEILIERNFTKDRAASKGIPLCPYEVVMVCM